MEGASGHLDAEPCVMRRFCDVCTILFCDQSTDSKNSGYPVLIMAFVILTVGGNTYFGGGFCFRRLVLLGRTPHDVCRKIVTYGNEIYDFVVALKSCIHL